MFLMVTLLLLIGLPNIITIIKYNKKYLSNLIEICIKFDLDILCIEKLKFYLNMIFYLNLVIHDLHFLTWEIHY